MSGDLPWQICQSCAWPLIRPEDKGTESDGSLSEEYCARCYQAGGFVHPDMTLAQMVDLVATEMTEKHRMPHEHAEAVACSILPGLKRWRSPGGS